MQEVQHELIIKIYLKYTLKKGEIKHRENERLDH